MSPTAEEDVRFIETDLVPELVHDRCFCEPNSREYVELESVHAESTQTSSHQLPFALYRATVVVQFSGEPVTFRVLIKLLREDSSEASATRAYDGFLNEEILWNKGTLQYGRVFLPRFYAVDMGRYGRPVVVVEDLERSGFERVVGRELGLGEAKAVVELVGGFHGRGLVMRERKFTVFREFVAKFQDVELGGAAEVESRERLNR